MILGELLVTVRELSEHINEPIDTDEDAAQARSMIKLASANVRAAGDPEWNRLNCPEIAHTVALSAAARGYLNPAGIDSERSDTLNLNRGEHATNGTELTRDEKAAIRNAAGRLGFIISVPLVRPDRVSDEIDSATAVT